MRGKSTDQLSNNVRAILLKLLKNKASSAAATGFATEKNGQIGNVNEGAGPYGKSLEACPGVKAPLGGMTAAIVADVSRAVVLLAESGNTTTAEALKRWLAGGEDFETAAGLSRGWRTALKQAARDRALSALLALFPHIDAQGLARRIAAGVKQAEVIDGIRRPDREEGYYWDVARAGVRLSERTWRLLIAEARGKATHRTAITAMSLWSASKLLEK